jgi:hypothetical protein
MLFFGIGKRNSLITIEFYQTTMGALLANLFDHCENGIDDDLGPVWVNEVFAILKNDVAAMR